MTKRLICEAALAENEYIFPCVHSHSGWAVWERDNSGFFSCTCHPARPPLNSQVEAVT